MCGLAFVYLGLEPRYRLADQVPDQQQAVQASGRLDAKLAGSNPIDVLVQFPADQTLYSPQTLAVIAETHEVLERQPGVGNVWSLETLRRWLAQKLGKPDVATLKQYVDLLPRYLVRRFVSEDQKSVIVSGYVPDKDSARLLPIVNQLDEGLGAVRARHPGYKIAVTGLSVIAARNSAAMIGKLNAGLTVEFLFVALFIGLAFRSLPVAFAVLPPGVFPILTAGALLRDARIVERADHFVSRGQARTSNAVATISESHRIGAPAASAPRAAAARPLPNTMFCAASTTPQAWIMRTATSASSGEKRDRSASARMIAKERS